MISRIGGTIVRNETLNFVSTIKLDKANPTIAKNIIQDSILLLLHSHFKYVGDYNKITNSLERIVLNWGYLYFTNLDEEILDFLKLFIKDWLKIHNLEVPKESVYNFISDMKLYIKATKS